MKTNLAPQETAPLVEVTPRPDGPAMLKYRCYFLNRVGSSIAVKTIQSESEDGARLSALDMLRLLRRAETLELWQGTELCQRLGRDALEAL